MKPARPKSLLVELAANRVLNGGHDAAERLERAALEGIKTGDWANARKSLKLRLAMRLKPEPKNLAAIERILCLVDDAEARGLAGTNDGCRPLRDLQPGT